MWQKGGVLYGVVRKEMGHEGERFESRDVRQDECFYRRDVRREERKEGSLKGEMQERGVWQEGGVVGGMHVCRSC